MTNVTDRPLEGVDGILKDELGLVVFARRLALAISKIDAHDGFVVAINGPWGSGKTSVAHFTNTFLSLSESGENTLSAINDLDVEPPMQQAENIQRSIQLLNKIKGPDEDLATVQNSLRELRSASRRTVVGIYQPWFGRRKNNFAEELDNYILACWKKLGEKCEYPRDELAAIDPLREKLINKGKIALRTAIDIASVKGLGGTVEHSLFQSDEEKDFQKTKDRFRDALSRLLEKKEKIIIPSESLYSL